MRSISFYLGLAVSSVLDLLGILTLITNEGEIAFDAELGFNIPVILISPEAQGLTLFIGGSVILLASLFSK